MQCQCTPGTVRPAQDDQHGTLPFPLAPIAIKAAGISCVIAETFARIFSRNSINIGLPILESAEAAKRIRKADRVSVDITTGEIKNITRKEKYSAEEYPVFMRRIISSGGLMNYVRKRTSIGTPCHE